MIGDLVVREVLPDLLLPLICQLTFWQGWQPIQQRYLSLEFRQSLRSLLTTPILTSGDRGFQSLR